MSLYVLGALLVVAGVAFLAVQTIRHGPLSQRRALPRTAPSLEPSRQGGIFDFKGNWLGYLLIVVGIALLLAPVPA